VRLFESRPEAIGRPRLAREREAAAARPASEKNDCQEKKEKEGRRLGQFLSDPTDE
jgi:hypothetical protein